MNFSFAKRKKEPLMHTIAFYNLENLFDTVDDPLTRDDDFTPKGSKKWTNKRYKKKLFKLGKAISEIGGSEGFPVLFGVAEVENKTVIENLLGSDHLRDMDYGYVHYDSPDERGIDCALVYHKAHFKVFHSEPITLKVFDTNGRQDATRDILYVSGKLGDEALHIFVNHWPSRRDGGAETDHKRMTAAETLLDFMRDVEKRTKNPNFIVMGDFNDGPKSESIQKLMSSEGLYNPMEKLLSYERGSANYKMSWMLFDQIMVSRSFLNFEKGTHSFAHANIFDEHFLTEFEGRYKGTPFRTYVGRKYLGGYSDHFPVYIQLKYNA
ncbi:MAG: endonuclease [Pricia sp.]